MRGLLRRLFVEDALLKALALALAVALFVVVRGDKDAAAGAYVKVVYKLPTDRVLVSDPIGEVRLGVRGPWSRVSRLDERDIPALEVDLGRVTDGDFNFTDDMIRLPAGLRLASISPPSVKLKFEPSVQRTVPIAVVVEGEPAAGFRVGRTEARPREVRVEGAKSIVEAQARVPVRVSVTDAEGPVHAEVKLEAPPPHTRWLSTERVAVDVDVAPQVGELVLRALPVRLVGLGKSDGRLEPSTVDVVLRGGQAALAEVQAGAVAPLVDAQAEDGRPAGTFAKRVTVAGLPPGVTAEVRPDAIALTTRHHKD